MKRYAFAAMLALIPLSLLCAHEKATPPSEPQRAELSLSFSPVSLYSLYQLGVSSQAETVDVESLLWGALSANLSVGRQEWCFSVSKYPNYFGLGIEKRRFFNARHSGFFIAPFMNAETITFLRQPGNSVAYSTSSYVYSGLEGETFQWYGLRFGFEIGARIRLGGLGITPTFGTAVSVGTFDSVGQSSLEDAAEITSQIELLRVLQLGLMIDLM